MTSDISAIREQLKALHPPMRGESDLSTRPGASSPSLPEWGAGDVGWQSPQQVEMAQALRQRSAPPEERPPTPEEMAARSTGPGLPPEPPNLHRYLQRLHSEAERINELYHQQEAAIRKFQSSVQGLSLILMKQPQPGGVRPEQFCEIRDAALTTVIQDEHNRYILTAVDLDLTLAEQQASQTAASLRARSQIRSAQGRPKASIAALANSAQGITTLWRSLTATLDSQAQITPLDVLVWCGGGIIGRLALDLALAAFPGLWHWVIAITIGAVALGLYRLLFAPKTDVAFIARLFLALLGLGIGGQI